MHPVRDLEHLRSATEKRLADLESMTPGSRVLGSKQLDRTCAFVCIELLNCWVNFSRSLYFSSCFHAKDLNGTRIQTSKQLRRFADAQFFAAQRFTQRQLIVGRIDHRTEPNWVSKDTVNILLSEIGASNSVAVASALTFPNRVLIDLATVRNFYAHRNSQTASKVGKLGVNYGMRSGVAATDLCIAYAPGRPQSVVRDWIAELRTISEFCLL